jgi:hypothetical protein
MIAEGERATLRIAVAGRAPEGERWARALRGIEGVAVRTFASAAELIAEDPASFDAVVLARSAGEALGAAKRALLAGQHLLVAPAPALTSRQFQSLDALARSRRSVAMFATDATADERVAFVRRMAGGPHALWRPRYIRSIRTGCTAGSLDEAAIGDVAFVLALGGGTPAGVSATAVVDQDGGAIAAAMMTLAFEGDAVARIDVSRLEPEPRHEVVIACDGRTMVLDATNTLAPLQIKASTRHRGPQSTGAWEETTSEHPAADARDACTRVADTFVAAVRERDVNASTARELAAAALVWERARDSAGRGGELMALEPQATTARPALRVIGGGGRRTAGAAPDLTVVETRPASA